MPQSGNVSKFRFICSFQFFILSGYTSVLLYGLIHSSHFCKRKEMSWSYNIISRDLSRLRSPIRPFILPPHAEQVAQAFANASLPEPVDESFGVPREVERYFDVAAEVGGGEYIYVSVEWRVESGERWLESGKLAIR